MKTPSAVLLGDEPEHLNEAQRWLAAALDVMGYRFDNDDDTDDSRATLVTGFHWDTTGGDYVTSGGAQTFDPAEATTFDRNRQAAFDILNGRRGDAYAFESDLRPCRHCGKLRYYGTDGWYHHLDPAEPVCFLTSADPDTGDGDPSFPGGLGCPQCDSLWATADSLERHLAASHGTYEEATT